VHFAVIGTMHEMSCSRNAVRASTRSGFDITALASDTLKERFRKAAERKKAEQEDKERQEKLQKLAEKFNQR
jgi:hypothetical protein